MQNYKIASAFTIGGLESDVNKLISQGYQVQGGVTQAAGRYAQALIKNS